MGDLLPDVTTPTVAELEYAATPRFET